MRHFSYETLGFEKRDRSHLFQSELEDYLVADTGKYYRCEAYLIHCDGQRVMSCIPSPLPSPRGNNLSPIRYVVGLSCLD